jgi:hypothetical protein
MQVSVIIDTPPFLRPAPHLPLNFISDPSALLREQVIMLRIVFDIAQPSFLAHSRRLKLILTGVLCGRDDALLDLALEGDDIVELLVGLVLLALADLL